MRRAARVARDAIARVHQTHASKDASRALVGGCAPSSASLRDDVGSSRDLGSIARDRQRRGFTASASSQKTRSGSKRATMPITAEEMTYDKIVRVTDSKQRLAPRDGTFYGAPPKTWAERELETVDARELEALDALFETYVEGAYVEGSGLPTYEEALAGRENLRERAESERAASASDEGETVDSASESADEEKETAPFVRVPIRDAAGRSYGTGRRKTAVARVWLAPGPGEHKVNGRPYDEYFSSPTVRGEMVAPFFVSDTVGLFTAVVDVRGGGISGQAQACRHGISVALQNYDPVFRPALKAAGYLTRDSRIVERKKPGKAKARKSFAWVKR